MKYRQSMYGPGEKPTRSEFAEIKKILLGKIDHGYGGNTLKERYEAMVADLHPRCEEAGWIRAMYEELVKNPNYRGFCGGIFIIRLAGIDYGDGFGVGETA